MHAVGLRLHDRRRELGARVRAAHLRHGGQRLGGARRRRLRDRDEVHGHGGQRDRRVVRRVGERRVKRIVLLGSPQLERDEHVAVELVVERGAVRQIHAAAGARALAGLAALVEAHVRDAEPDAVGADLVQVGAAFPELE